MASHIHSFRAQSVKPSVSIELEQLCFIAKRPGGKLDLWCPPSSNGNWAADCALGREMASQLICYLQDTDDGAVLPGIVRTIVARGNFDGVGVGFFSAISSILARDSGANSAFISEPALDQ